MNNWAAESQHALRRLSGRAALLKPLNRSGVSRV